MSDELNNSDEVIITCGDGVKIIGTLFKPHQTLKGAVLIAPATGIKRQLYIRFAQYLAKSGYVVLTFDNRGIGESLAGKVKHSTVSLQCWGEQDMPAALDFLMTRFPLINYHLIGHSAGGQLIGLMNNARHISSVFNVSSSSGCLKNMSFPFIISANFFMNIVIPLSNFIFGHTKAQWFGMGEPLPKQVARQWQKWCNGQGYVKTAFGKTVHQHLYNELAMPAIWVNASDDHIANDINVADMISVFPKMQAQTLTLNKEDYDLDEIGHIKFFSRNSQALWKHTTDWLALHS
ncbi:alpha/beta hydrolase family protein [Colwellia hornerae]|uniref:Alpha/beta fold hydrolase n=1 Tax=Colwellia hornerae TaxID=89402 RepID=A0A5C6Q1W4_9GAMM|nr:alpha/beta fold hydrolase [Colwellia hornerae]TWX44903.1 alpha/beta fold hydrolase [Colwellia hornerae]TWX53108.1 alpha/beta fold hydrolase [Colwellia hornerae]TWX62223.1 alpha/beta fold hydrolase [Colwellia hornerae]